FNNRPAFTDAEIQRTNLAAVILQMLQLRLGDIGDFPFVDPPDSRFITDGFKLLEELGAVDSCRQLSAVGRQLARLPVDPRIARMVIEAAQFDALKEVLIIASALSVQDPRERPHDKRQAADEKHRLYADEYSDFITLLNLWNLYEEQRAELSQNQLRNWCQKHFISFMRMREWRDVHRQLHLSVKELKLHENAEPADYAPVHRSLLAGLLSHIGNLVEKGEYLGARNRRFRIFPGSGLFKKSPKWVMAAELIETSKLYAHHVAKIEPEWIEAPAAHLVKRTWSEPHWEKKRAQVVATEQVSLYGLVIVPKRRVNYGQIDPRVSHEIFIRSALVEGAFSTRAPFFNRNRALLDDVETLESKARRRDLLVDEEGLYQFYAERLERLGGGHIVNGAGFEKWYKKQRQIDADVLVMTEADILQRSSDHISQALYPDVLRLDGVDLKLEYVFDPASDKDGVTLQCPLALLKALPRKRLEWSVPGLLEEKVIAILKGLPKQLRKHFVPVPEYAKAFCESVTFADGDLYEALSFQLLRMTGVKVDPSQLKASALEQHQQLNISLIDAQNRVVGEGRDWEVLNQRYSSQVEEAIQAGSDESWGRDQIVRWDFGDIEDSIHVKQAGGIEVEAWPGLEDQGDHVELKLFTSADESRVVSKRAVARLLLLVIPEVVKYVRRQLPALDKILLLSGKRFDRKRLEEEILIKSVSRAARIADNDTIRTKAAFDAALEHARANLAETANDLCGFVLSCHQRLHAIEKRLGGRIDLSAVTVLNDIKQQLAGLMHPRYLSDTPDVWLEQYPRYFQAIEIRLDRFQRELRQQIVLSEQLASLKQQYEKRCDEARAQDALTDDLREFRWWLEEYRVSLFAQQLGTRFTVSEKRLRKRLSELM
ncbi:MAG: ATP-dependent RNA helicase HrpA, partial [Oceanospirillales bacterium]|nr:ATP-dependent RNA helicase HrpA [Oceanospirillales bacterium]